MPREFIEDFLQPALRGLNSRDAARVALALDTAIAFGALEALSGNESLTDVALVEAKYADNVRRLKT